MARMTNKEFKNILTEWIRLTLNEQEENNLRGEREKLEYISKNKKSGRPEVRTTITKLSQDKSSEVRKAAASTQLLSAEAYAAYFSDSRNEAEELTSAFSANRGNFNTPIIDKIFDAVKNSGNLKWMTNVFAQNENTSEDVLEYLADIASKGENGILARKIMGNPNCPSYIKKDLRKVLDRQ